MKTIREQFTKLVEPFPIPDDVLMALLKAVKERDAHVLGKPTIDEDQEGIFLQTELLSAQHKRAKESL